MEGSGDRAVAQPETGQPPAQFVGGLSREGEDDRVLGVDRLGEGAVRDPTSEDRGLSGTSTGDHREERRRRHDGLSLGFVESEKDVVGRRGHAPRVGGGCRVGHGQ